MRNKRAFVAFVVAVGVLLGIAIAGLPRPKDDFVVKTTAPALP